MIDKVFKSCFTILVFILLAGQCLLHESCQRLDDRLSIQKVDTLDRLVQRIQGTLIIDQDAIKQRRDSMKIKLDNIQMHPQDTIDAEKKSAVLRYTGIFKNYQDFLNDYPIAQYDADKAAEKVTELKKKVIDKQISQADFDREYIADKEMLTKLNDRVKDLAYKTYSAEGDYDRTNDIVTGLYHKDNSAQKK